VSLHILHSFRCFVRVGFTNLKWMMKKADFYTSPANIRHTVNHVAVINVTLCVFWANIYYY